MAITSSPICLKRHDCDEIRLRKILPFKSIRYVLKKEKPRNMSNLPAGLSAFRIESPDSEVRSAHSRIRYDPHSFVRSLADMILGTEVCRAITMLARDCRVARVSLRGACIRYSRLCTLSCESG
jgi:hypothetical protein